MVIKRNRNDYAFSSGSGSTLEVDVEAVARVVLEMPETYAKDLLAEILAASETATGDDCAEIRVDIPVRLTLDQEQLKKMAEQFDYKLRRSKLKEVP